MGGETETERRIRRGAKKQRNLEGFSAVKSCTTLTTVTVAG